ncbi:integrase catalytic domain-containing protein, partial [Trichonephila clavipes]
MATGHSLPQFYFSVRVEPRGFPQSYLISHSISWTIGNFNLTIEEFLTVVNQVEGILNSRSLIPLSSDPNDFGSLTPGHFFLIGRPINFIPESIIIDIPGISLVEGNLPSCSWSMGRIQDVVTEKDGKVRVVMVKTSR